MDDELKVNKLKIDPKYAWSLSVTFIREHLEKERLKKKKNS